MSSSTVLLVFGSGPHHAYFEADEAPVRMRLVVRVMITYLGTLL